MPFVVCNLSIVICPFNNGIRAMLTLEEETFTRLKPHMKPWVDELIAAALAQPQAEDARALRERLKPGKQAPREIAAHAGISLKYLYSIERGETGKPRLRALANLARAIGCTENEYAAAVAQTLANRKRRQLRITN